MSEKKRLSILFSRWLFLFLIAFFLSFSVGKMEAAASSMTYRVTLNGGYLPLRTARYIDPQNEIGQLYDGETVELWDSNDPSFWYVYASRLGLYGYVNSNCLQPLQNGSAQYNPSSPSNPSTPSSPTNQSNVWTVTGVKHYLALRTAKAYDEANEIGCLNNGETVTVIDSSDSTYWYVYSASLNKEGFVNKNYLSGGNITASTSAENTFTVKVKNGYLALRSGMAFNYNNELGALYSDDTVDVIDYSDPTFWYVYSPKLNQRGYVDRSYLIRASFVRYVKIKDGYLNLRSSKDTTIANQVGQLYNGDPVKVLDREDDTFYYVYVPKLDTYGYVASKYLS